MDWSSDIKGELIGHKLHEMKDGSVICCQRINAQFFFLISLHYRKFFLTKYNFQTILQINYLCFKAL